MVYITQASWFARECATKWPQFEEGKLFQLFEAMDDKKYKQLKWWFYNLDEALKSELEELL